MILREYKIEENSARILTPQEVAMLEPLWFFIPFFRRILTRRKASKTPPSVHFGISYDEFYRRSGKPIDVLRSELNGTTVSDAYLISSGAFNHCVLVSFLVDASPEQQAKAYFHAWLLGNKLKEWMEKKNNLSDNVMDLKSRLEVEAETKTLLESTWGEFLKSCTDAGWNLRRSELQTQGYEVKVI